MNSNLTAVDLFAGCGGLTLGLKQSKFSVVLAVEYDRAAAASYRLNHPEVTLLESDVRDADIATQLMHLGLGQGDLDLLAACPPCQGFSTMTTLNEARSIPDSRNDLVLYVINILKQVRPKTFLLENVPNLAKNWRFARLRAALDNLGYHQYEEIVDAYDFGVPQRRKRLVLSASITRPPIPRRQKHSRRNVGDAIGHLLPPAFSKDWLHAHEHRRSPKVEQIIRHIPRNGGSRSSLPKRLILQCHLNTTGFKDVYGRLAWDAPSNTITSGCTNPSKGRFLHPEQDRALSLREASLLQAFPAKYRFAKTTLTQLALQIGNAIPPPLARAHSRALADTLIQAHERSGH